MKPYFCRLLEKPKFYRFFLSHYIAITLISATPIAVFSAFYASHHPVIIFNAKKYPHFNLFSQSEDLLFL